MLHLGHPATGGGLAERGIVLVIDVELLVLLAVVHGRTAERVALDVEHRTFLREHVPRELHVGGGLPVRCRCVLHVVLHVDRVLARLEDVGLHHGDALLVRPRQRHAQFLRAWREAELGGRRRVRRQVRRFGAAVGRTQAAAHDTERRVVRRQQAHRRAARLLVLRVLQQVGAQQVAALQADVHVQHVGDDANLRCSASHGGDGRRGAARPRQVQPRAPRRKAATAGSMPARPVQVRRSSALAPDVAGVTAAATGFAP